MRLRKSRVKSDKRKLLPSFTVLKTRYKELKFDLLEPFRRKRDFASCREGQRRLEQSKELLRRGVTYPYIDVASSSLDRGAHPSDRLHVIKRLGESLDFLYKQYIRAEQRPLTLRNYKKDKQIWALADDLFNIYLCWDYLLSFAISSYDKKSSLAAVREMIKHLDADVRYRRFMNNLSNKGLKNDERFGSCKITQQNLERSGYRFLVGIIQFGANFDSVKELVMGVDGVERLLKSQSYVDLGRLEPQRDFRTEF